MRYKLFAGAMQVLMLCSQTVYAQLEHLDRYYSGDAAFGEIKSADGATVIEHMIGEIAYDPASGSGLVVHSGLLPAYLVPVATVGIDQSGTLRAQDMQRSWSPLPTGVDDSLCQGETVRLRVTGGRSYLWSTGETTSTIDLRVSTDMTVWARAYIPGIGSSVDSTYPSIADTFHVSVRSMFAEIGLGTLPPIDPRLPTAIGVQIPITLLGQWNLDICQPDSITATIRVNRTLFKPRSVKPEGRIVRELLVGSDRFVTVTIPTPAERLVAGSVLAFLVGDVLLGNAISTPLQFVTGPTSDSIQWIKTGESYRVVTTVNDGSISLDSLCFQGGAPRLLDWDAPSISKIAPNPARHRATVTVDLPIGRAATIEVYDLTGTLVSRERIEPEGTTTSGSIKRVTRVLDLETDDLPNGAYQVVVRTEQHQSITFLLVAH